MTNTNKKNKNTRKLLGAVGMLSVSAAMLVSSTFAWFTMNKTVQATNMQVQAKADQGLLINEVSTANDSNWDALATTNQSGGIKLHATSTAETNTWYAAYSTAKSDAASATNTGASTLLADGYKTLGTTTGFIGTTETVSAIAGSNAQQDIYYVDADQDSAYDNGEGYYVKYTYYLKSSGDAITLSNTGAAKSLYIKDVAVTGNTNSANLDKALRVAIVVNGKAYIYAPLYDDADIPTSYVNATTATTPLPKTGSQATAMTSLNAVTADGTPVYVYLYFEGEDANLKTDNVTETLDDLTVSFKFELADHASNATDNGVAVSST
ncbi:MAG: hypothetical protein IJM32_01080 [Ruminococcus sp.]|nr:hypothetical protein [Ruminococcus sp.]